MSRRCLVFFRTHTALFFPATHEKHEKNFLTWQRWRKSAKNVFSFVSHTTEQKELAIRLYKEGILELERGINIDVWQGHGEKWVKAQRLHDKMQTNLAMAKDRLHFLGEFEHMCDLLEVEIYDWWDYEGCLWLKFMEMKYIKVWED